MLARYRQGQSALEFMVLMGAMFFFFIIFLGAFEAQRGEAVQEARLRLVKEIALSVQDEINLAHASRDGYERNFALPDHVLNIDYTITLVADSVYVASADGKHALALPVRNVTGNVQKGNNVIRKREGIVSVNS